MAVMKAAVFVSPGRIELRELSQPQPGRGEVSVRVAACGVCGTDVHIYRGKLREAVRPPVVLGHEIAGTVEAVGEGVDNVRVGQSVCVDPVISCGRCEYCHTGRSNLCGSLTTIGYVRNGGYAEVTVAPAGNLYVLKPQVPATGGILVETLACVLNGYEKLNPQPGRTAMILGAGSVGLLWGQLLRASPITLLIQTEPVSFRRQRAQQLGADVVIDPQTEDVAGRVRAIAPEGIDYVIDASGDPQAVEQGIGLVKKGGTFVVFGVCPSDATVRVSPYELYQKEMRIIGSKMPPWSLERAARMIEAGLIDHARLVGEPMPLQRLPEALEMFETARDRQIKMAIAPGA